MSLERQNFSVSFQQGLDTKTDEKQVVVGKLLSLENGVFVSGSAIVKRNGYQQLGRSIVNEAGSVPPSVALATYGLELLSITTGSVFSYSEVKDSWVRKGSISTCTVQDDNVVSSFYTQVTPDMVSVSGVEAYVWQDSRGIMARVIDQRTKTVYQESTLLTATGIAPRCASVGPYIFVTYIEPSSTSIRLRRLSPGDPANFMTEQVLTTNLRAANPRYDVGQYTTASCVLAYTDSTPALTVGHVTVEGEIGGPGAGLVAPQSFPNFIVNANSGLCVAAENMGYQGPSLGGMRGLICVAAKIDPPNASVPEGVHLLHLDHGLSAFGAIGLTSTTSSVIDTAPDVTGSAVSNLAMAIGLARPTFIYTIVDINLLTSVGSASLGLYYEISTPSGTDNHYVKSANITLNDLITSYSDKVNAGSLVRTSFSGSTWRSVGLGSKAYVLPGTTGTIIGDNARYRLPETTSSFVTLLHQSNLQSTYLTVRQDGLIVAKDRPLNAGSLYSASLLPLVSNPTGSEFIRAGLTKTQLVSADGDVFSLQGTYRSKVSMGTRPMTAQLGQDLHIAGGIVHDYDGGAPVEHGFHFFPEGLVLSSSVGTGIYQYCATYEWMDARGQVHRSAPSIPVSASMADPTGSSPTVRVPTLRMTMKSGSRGPVSIVLYRTEANGTTFYRQTPVTSPVANDTSIDSVTITDTLSDSKLIGNEILYTVGGVLENIAPPPATIMAVGKNRIFLAGVPEDPNLIYYSKEYRLGTGVEFSDVLTLRVDPYGGEIVAMYVMDEKLVIFKKNAIFIVNGDGPNDAGTGAFTEPALVTSDAGCTEQSSVTNTPDGIMFKSSKGIYMLDRGLNVSYIGAPVEAFNSLSITSAELIPDKNQVRFLTSDGSALVYDYYWKQWSTFTNHEGIDAALWKGSSYVYLRADGSVRREVPGYFRDVNSRIGLSLETAWIKLAGLQGFQRVRRASVLGNYRSPHVMQLSVGYDYQPGYYATITFDPATGLTRTYYGSGSYYGSDATYGGDGGDSVYQFEAYMPKQKCESIRFRFQDAPSSVTGSASPGDAFTLTDLNLQVGVKRGSMKLPTSKKVG